MNGIIKNILSTAALRDRLMGIWGKKGAPLNYGLVFHSEAVQNIRVFELLLQFAKKLSFRPALCVMTPRNPFIREDMKKRGISEDEFSLRLTALKKYYDIGYHGHWCRKGDGGTARYFSSRHVTAIEKEGFELTLNDLPAIRDQFNEEISYLRSLDIDPKIYAAGWWYLSDDLLHLLETEGIDLDCSLRCRYPDSFGNRYLPIDRFPSPGMPFPLGPGKKVIEVPSLEYVTMNWWTVMKSVLPLLGYSAEKRFAVLPLHDYNLMDRYDAVCGNIEALQRVRNTKWIDAAKLAGEACPPQTVRQKEK